ncbi:MAG TPA: hypothetical protein VGC32_03350 [Solirubrobacterales bacterium]
MSAPERCLPCGVDLENLVRQVFEGAEPVDPAHQRTCPHCQRALRRIRAARDDMRGLAAAPVVVPGGILRAVMARIRAKTALVTVAVGTRGATLVTDHLIADIARRAALAVPAVGHASVITAEEDAPGVIGLRVRLIVAYGPSLEEIATNVRDAISREIAETVGVTPGAIDVSIEDLA